MRLKHITLNKCKRLTNFKNREFSFDFDKDRPITTIVGSIGTGKSSFLYYTIPMLIVKSDFNVDGYRILIFEHDDNTYKIENRFNPIMHSIKKNGEELNLGLKSKTFNEVITRELDIKQDLWNLITSLDKFTDVSPTVRKDWLNTLSPNDYTFANRLYKELTIKQRDIKGALNIGRQKLNGMTKTKDNEYNAKLNTLNNVKRELREVMDQKMKYYVKDNPSLTSRNDTLNSLTNKINNLVRVIEQNPLKDEEELDSKVVDLKVKLKDTVNQIDRLNALSRSKANREELDSINKLIDDKINKLNTIFKNTNITIDNYHSVKQYIKDYGNRIEELLYYVNSNKGLILEKDSLLNKLEIMKSRYTQLVTDVRVKEQHQQHLKKLKELGGVDVECPSCNTKFKTLNDVKDEVDDIEKDSIKINELDSEIKNIESKLKVIEEIIKNQHELDNILYKKPNGIKIEYEEDLNTIHRALDLLKDYDDLINRKNSLISLSEDVVENIEERWKEVNHLNRVYTNQLNEIEKFIKDRTMLKTLKEEYDKVIALHKEYLDYKGKREKFTELIEKERVKTNEYDVLLEEIRHIESNNNDINKLELDNRSLEDELLSINLLVNNLSPKNGLIAESMGRFIDHVVEKMNEFIKSILMYKMEILPPEDISNLDYRFRVRFGDGDMVKDVKYLSTGQKELVNTSFLLVVHELLGKELPLYLDEFAANFDDVHRAKGFKVINSMADKDIQILLITHLAEGRAGGSKVKFIDLNKG